MAQGRDARQLTKWKTVARPLSAIPRGAILSITIYHYKYIHLCISTGPGMEMSGKTRSRPTHDGR